jgi:hypothetical protein
MSLDKPSKEQLKLLESIELPEEEWAKDIIWIKRKDVVSDKEMQKKAEDLYRDLVSEHSLFSRVERKFILISEVDNVWGSQRQMEK